MDGVVTLLNPEQDALIHQVWRDLRKECGVSGIEVTPIPHFSWNVGESYDLVKVGQVLAEISAASSPFTVVSAGLGLFLRPAPVIYLPLAKNRALLELHALLWNAVTPLGSGINPHYSPETWMPHITLAQWGLDPESMHCAIDQLLERHLGFEIAVDNLAIICQQGGQVGELRSSYPFRG